MTTSTRRQSIYGCIAAVVLAASSLMCTGAVAEDYHAIFSGTGGEEEFQEKFRSWGTRLRDALVMRLDVPMENVTLLSEPQVDSDSAPEFSTTSLESIRAVMTGIGARVTPDDDLYIYLIGHGSYIKATSKFLIPGTDLTAEELGQLLDDVNAQRIIVLNSTSSSAGFINVLSGPNRIVCSATKSASELNATEFLGFFVEGLEDGSADRNHDERISILEACEQAAELTASWYTAEGLLATEHAILDDNGDSLGSRLPVAAYLEDLALNDADAAQIESVDGGLAANVYLKDYQFHPDAPQQLIDTYLTALEEAQALIKRKSEVAEEDYLVELERLLVKAARANREIHGYGEASHQDS